MKQRPSSGGNKGSYRSFRETGSGGAGKRPASSGRPASKDRPFAKDSEGRKPADKESRFKKEEGKPYRPKPADGTSDRPKRDFGGKAVPRDGARKPFEKGERFNKEEKPYRARPEGAGDRTERPKREYGGKPDARGGERKPFEKSGSYNKEERPSRPRPDGGTGDRNERPKREYGGKAEARGAERKPFEKSGSYNKEERPSRPRPDGGTGDRNERPKREYGGKAEARGAERKPFEKAGRFNKEGKAGDSERPARKHDGAGSDKPPFGKKPSKFKTTSKRDVGKGPKTPHKFDDEKAPQDPKKGSFARSFDYHDRPKFDGPKKERREEEVEEEKPKTAFKTPHKFKKPGEEKPAPTQAPSTHTASGKPKRKPKWADEDDEEDMEDEGENKQMTLNKYIAHSGECGRREAAELVKQGKVKVNGELVTDPGYRVQDTDKVTMVGKKLTPVKDLTYILLNKPKGFITTTEDPQERKTVMDLVDNAGVERLYPVGRLDRNTSGLLLLTNDGDLAQKLSHPGYAIKKVYQVTLDKNVTKVDFEKIVSGIELEDGIAVVDEIAYLENKNEIGLEIHSGRNRIVRRIFESMGYVVEKLDRVMYAGLTKKNLPRGKWRLLTDQEIVHIKHFKS